MISIVETAFFFPFYFSLRFGDLQLIENLERGCALLKIYVEISFLDDDRLKHIATELNGEAEMAWHMAIAQLTNYQMCNTWTNNPVSYHSKCG